MPKRKPPYDMRVTPLAGPRPGQGTVRVFVSPIEMVEVPAHIEVFAENDRYSIELRTGLQGVEHVIDSLTVRRKDSESPGVSSSSLRALGFAGLLEYAIERSTIHFVRDNEKETLWHTAPLDFADWDPNAVSPHARHFIPRKGRRPTPPEQVESEIRAAADAYKDAIQRNLHAPIQHVRKMLGIGEKTAQRRVRAARERGLIEED
jgi:hypothetical protein